MEQRTELNQAQLGILRLLGRMNPLEIVEELRRVITNYYEHNFIDEMDPKCFSTKNKSVSQKKCIFVVSNSM